MQRRTSDDNRRGVMQGGEVPKALTGTGEDDLEGLFVRLDYAIRTLGAKPGVLDTIESPFAGLTTGHGTNVQLVAAHIRPITFLLSGLITTATQQGAHDVRSLNE